MTVALIFAVIGLLSLLGLIAAIMMAAPQHRARQASMQVTLDAMRVAYDPESYRHRR